MSSRITFGIMDNNLMAALNQSLQTQNTAASEVESGESVLLPSDNPGAAAEFSLTQAQNSSLTQYLQNINTLNGGMQVADSALSSATTLLNQAVTLGTSGANGTTTATQQQSLAGEVGQIQQQILNVANTTFQGQYLFAGNGSGPAFVADNQSPSGVTYQGSTTQNKVEIAPGTYVAAGVPGDQLFNNSQGSVFQALQDLQNALQSGDNAGAQTAVTELNTAMNQLSVQRATYGSTMDDMASTQTLMQNEQTTLAQQENNLVGANMADAISNLSNAETVRQAVLEMGSQLTNTSLLNITTTG